MAWNGRSTQNLSSQYEHEAASLASGKRPDEIPESECPIVLRRIIPVIA
ncbi:MAG: hypothetical protein WBP56_03220 [Polyangia bacterium]